MLSDFLTRSHTDCSVKEFAVQPADIGYLQDFIEHWHYSNNVTGLRADYNFGLYHQNDLIGAMIYGRVAMPNAWRKFVDKEEDLIELRRLCCIDDTPRNTESYFIGKPLKWLKKNTDIKTVVSYADSFHGHEGTIYKASNFTHVGMTPPGKMVEYQGRLYHDKVLRNYQWKNGEKVLDENGNSIRRKDCQRFHDALETGEAQIVETPGKHTYVYNLR